MADGILPTLLRHLTSLHLPSKADLNLNLHRNDKHLNTFKAGEWSDSSKDPTMHPSS
jgi:hypothetical protein